MKPTLVLAWRYLAHYPVRTTILVLCIALITFLPIAVELLVRFYQDSLTLRAQETPLVLGAKGSRFDLLLNSLYFKGKLSDSLSMAVAQAIRADGRATPIPLISGPTARGHPVIGTSLDYFDFRRLRPREGTLPLLLGDCVLGAGVAQKLGIHAGGSLLSDTKKLYDISSIYPLKMRVAGVLEESHGADDWVVFVDLKTAWIIRGIGHGHQNVDEGIDPDLILKKTDGQVATNAAITEYTEVTADNIDSFHFHGGPEDFPVSAILVLPRDRRAATILKARYSDSRIAQPLVPALALAELMDIVFRVKRFFDLNLALVSVAATLFLALIVLLSVRVRERELETLFKIGCRRATVVRILSTELFVVLSTGILLGAAVAGLLYGWVATGPLRL